MAALDVIPILAAEEPSKAPFYIAGGVLASWAVVVSVIGIMKPDFPKGRSPARLVMGLSAILVLFAVGTAVATSTKHTESGEPGSKGAGEPQAETGEEGRAGDNATFGEPTPTPGQEGQPDQEPDAARATLRLAADPGGQLAYVQKSATTRAGDVTIAFTNRSPVPHNVVIEQGGRDVGRTPVIQASNARAEVELEAGSYVYYCSVDAHRQAGMEGRLTVR